MTAAAAKAEAGAACRKAGARPSRASSRVLEARNEIDRCRALVVASWAVCWSKRMSMNMRMRRSKGMAGA